MTLDSTVSDEENQGRRFKKKERKKNYTVPDTRKQGE